MFSPFARSNIFAPGYSSGPFCINFVKKLLLRSFTFTGLVIFIAIFIGTPNWRIDKFGSPVITERALKSTRFPIRFPLIRPYLLFKRSIIHCNGRPERCCIGAEPFTLLFAIIATKY